MEKKIQELKDLFKGDAEMFIVKNIERFYEILTDISNEYLVKSKERELELKESINLLEKQKSSLNISIEPLSKEYQETETKLEKARKQLKETQEKQKELDMIKEGVLADIKMVEAMKADVKKQKETFEKEKQQFQVQKAMVEEQVKTLRKLNI
jgi:chromosome segregation ATPase